ADLPKPDPVRRVAARFLPESVKRVIRPLAAPLLTESAKRAKQDGMCSHTDATDSPLWTSIDWMPAARYQHHWRSMRAFALPSFYDGRIRINLVGRERHGGIPVAKYKALCDEIEALLLECRDPSTGEPMVDYIERAEARDPLTLGPTESDLVVVWKGVSCALDHPRLGRVGPVPFRRTGGHTG